MGEATRACPCPKLPTTHDNPIPTTHDNPIPTTHDNPIPTTHDNPIQVEKLNSFTYSNISC